MRFGERPHSRGARTGRARSSQTDALRCRPDGGDRPRDGRPSLRVAGAIPPRRHRRMGRSGLHAVFAEQLRCPARAGTRDVRQDRRGARDVRPVLPVCHVARLPDRGTQHLRRPARHASLLRVPRRGHLRARAPARFELLGSCRCARGCGDPRGHQLHAPVPLRASRDGVHDGSAVGARANGRLATHALGCRIRRPCRADLAFEDDDGGLCACPCARGGNAVPRRATRPPRQGTQSRIRRRRRRPDRRPLVRPQRTERLRQSRGHRIRCGRGSLRATAFSRVVGLLDERATTRSRPSGAAARSRAPPLLLHRTRVARRPRPNPVARPSMDRAHGGPRRIGDRRRRGVPRAHVVTKRGNRLRAPLAASARRARRRRGGERPCPLAARRSRDPSRSRQPGRARVEERLGRAVGERSQGLGSRPRSGTGNRRAGDHPGRVRGRRLRHRQSDAAAPGHAPRMDAARARRRRLVAAPRGATRANRSTSYSASTI